MLRRISLAVIALATLAVATNAQAQAATGDRPKMGLGIAANLFKIDQAGGILPGGGIITVPLMLTPQLKVEPLVGLNTSNDGTDFSDITLGAGLYALQRSAPNMDLYVGGRLILDFLSVSAGGASDSATDLKLAAVAGAEYYVAPKFSVGAEADVGFYSNGNAPVSTDTSGFFTAGLVFLRFYL